MIELPLNFVTDLTASANTQVSNFSPLLVLVMGILLAVAVVGALVAMVTHK